MKVAFIILIIFVINSSLIGDTIVTKNGTYYGRILSATKSSVNFETSKKIIALDKDQILSYSFSASDILYLKSGETINCKIVGILKGYVVYVTPQKVFKQKQADVARIKNNVGSKLLIKSLPRTTNGFIPTSEDQIEIDKDESSKYVYLKLPVLGLLNSSLNDWKGQFVTKAGNHPDSKGYPIGGEVGFAINRNLSLGIGYEYFYHPPISIIDNSITDKGEDNIFYSFTHGSIKFNVIQKSYVDIYLNGNFGLLQTKEKIKDLQGITTTLNGETFAGRIKVGIAFPFSDKISGFVEIGYLSAKSKEIKSKGQSVPKYNLDFSGINFTGGVNFSIHL